MLRKPDQRLGSAQKAQGIQRPGSDSGRTLHPSMHHRPGRPRLPESARECVCAPPSGSAACTLHAGSCRLPTRPAGCCPRPPWGCWRRPARHRRWERASRWLSGDGGGVSRALALFPFLGRGSCPPPFPSLPARRHAREGARGRGAARDAWPRPARSPALALRLWRSTTATRTRAALLDHCLQPRSAPLTDPRECRQGGGMEW